MPFKTATPGARTAYLLHTPDQIRELVAAGKASTKDMFTGGWIGGADDANPLRHLCEAFGLEAEYTALKAIEDKEWHRQWLDAQKPRRWDAPAPRYSLTVTPERLALAERLAEKQVGALPALTARQAQIDADYEADLAAGLARWAAA
jgi:hypothetical protein